MIRADRTGLHRPWDNHRWFTTRGWQEIRAGMAANRSYGMQKTSDFRIGWVRCWNWRKPLGRRGRTRVGFLHSWNPVLWNEHQWHEQRHAAASGHLIVAVRSDR